MGSRVALREQGPSSESLPDGLRLLEKLPSRRGRGGRGGGRRQKATHISRRQLPVPGDLAKTEWRSGSGGPWKESFPGASNGIDEESTKRKQTSARLPDKVGSAFGKNEAQAHAATGHQ